MSSFQHLRDFIRERLTAAAEEIFIQVEKTIVRYEEDIKLLESCWKPQIKLTRIDDPKQQVCRTEEVLNQEEPEPEDDKLSDAEHVLSEEDKENQEGPLMSEGLEGLEPNHREPEPEPPHQESGPEEPRLQAVEICSGQQLPPDCDAFMKPLSDEECELEPDMDQNLPGSDQDRFKSDPHQIKEDLEQQLQGTKKQKRLPAKSNKSQRKVRKKENVVFCATCGKRYYYVKSLVTHMRTHVKLYSCETCGNKFSSAEALSRHMGEHSLDQLHSCETCGERFYQESALLTHIRDHSDETPDPCEVCGKRCLTGKALLVHMRSHGAEKSY
ncbi:zinc finger and SCAN domain-containing protein 2-like [Poecilia reticulata]|uniref:zinc finger and SCAN domain-containing protein 2-like n=1 Tax=Poecilia reticulata TaxID=8081 RepID=UPI0004A3F09D|nr:PREDICTED: zinc finger and SCAN domain-containing protein 2-like [Poecilia reticulata]